MPIPKKNDYTFIILLRYADAAGHKLNVKYAAEASGIAIRTAFTKVANAKKLLEDSLPPSRGVEAFQVLLRYAELSGHKLNAADAATAANIALRTAFTKIAEAKKAIDTTKTVSESSAHHVQNATEGRKRKVPIAFGDNGATNDSEETIDTAKKSKRAPKLKAEVKVEWGAVNGT